MFLGHAIALTLHSLWEEIIVEGSTKKKFKKEGDFGTLCIDRDFIFFWLFFSVANTHT